MSRHIIHTWAIDSRSEHHGLIGVYWFSRDKLKDHMSGIRTATFKTRKNAREHLPLVKRVFPKARVVKIKASIEW